MNDYSLNLAECLVHKQNLTYTLVQNVCNGESYQVPHGTVDYLAGTLLGCLFLLLFALVAFGVYVVLSD